MIDRTEDVKRLATEVMGWGLRTDSGGLEVRRKFWVWVDEKGYTGFGYDEWNPFTSWDHAGMLWRKLKKKGYNISIFDNETSDDVLVKIDMCQRPISPVITRWGDSVPAAISEAALATVGEGE